MPNPRSALDARMAFCLHTRDHRPGASESGRWLLMRIGLFLALIVASTALALSTIPSLERSDAVFTGRVLSTARVRVESREDFKWELWKAEVSVQATLKQDTNLVKQTTIYFPQDHRTATDHYIMSCPARPRIATNGVYEF